VAKPTRIGGLSANTPLGDAALGILLARLFDVRRQELALFERLDEDGVHDLRVATRRLRAAIRLFGKKALRRAEAEVEQLQDALGEVRDLHVQRAWLAQVSTRGPERQVLAAIDRDRAHALVGAERQLLLALKRWVEVGAPAVERAAHRVRGRGALRGETVAAGLERALEKLRRARQAALGSDRPEVLHAFRIRLKQFRYLAELPGPALDPALEGPLEAAASIQDEVGALHDLDERMGLLQEPAWTLPVLFARLGAERERRARAVQRRLSALAL
jgi:CHAD domain-containing protein